MLLRLSSRLAHFGKYLCPYFLLEFVVTTDAANLEKFFPDPVG